MPLDPETILKIDKGRIGGMSASDIHEALEKAGFDADQAFKEYAGTPFKDGRLRVNVNLGDPLEWLDDSEHQARMSQALSLKMSQEQPAPATTTTTRSSRPRKGRPDKKKKGGVPQGYKGKKGGIYEVFYDPAGEYWDSGGIQKGAIGGHDDHVHVSADRGYIVKIGKFAQKMGLTVGEQKRFGGTPTSGHTGGSFHYKDMGIDVSGDADKMAKFAQIMRREAKRGHGK